jgi:hypothetical protein
MLAHDVAMRATLKVRSEWRMITGARGQQMVAPTWSDLFEVAFFCCGIKPSMWSADRGKTPPNSLRTAKKDAAIACLGSGLSLALAKL